MIISRHTVHLLLGAVRPVRLALLATIAMVVVAMPTRSQTLRNGGVSDPLAKVRVGDWVRLDGTLQSGAPVLCTEVKVLIGDFLDDDWSVVGAVTAIRPDRKEMKVGGLPVLVTENTTFEGPHPGFRSFSDLRPGMILDVEGTYLKSGRFLAAEVDHETDETLRTPNTRNHVQVVGRVERLDLRKHLIVALGTTFQWTERTTVRSVIE